VNTENESTFANNAKEVESANTSTGSRHVVLARKMLYLTFKKNILLVAETCGN